MLARYSLRTKLLAIVAIPVLLSTVLFAVRVTDRVQEASQAQSELDDIARSIRLAEFLNVLRDERDAQLSLDATEDDVVAARTATDDAFDNFTVLFADEPELVAQGTEGKQGLDQLRNMLPADPATVRRRVAAELSSGDPDEQAPTANSVIGFNDFVSALTGFGRFDSADVSSGEGATSLNSLQLAIVLQEAMKVESTTYTQLGEVPAAGITADVLSVAYGKGDAVASLEQAFGLVASNDTAERFGAIGQSPNAQRLLEIRGAVRSTQVGTELAVSSDEIAKVWDATIGDLDVLQLDLLDQSVADADGVRDSARRSALVTSISALVLALLLGSIVIALYRSIRRPLRAVTEQSLKLADVELPSAVAVMRENPQAELPRLTEIEAKSSDEIGDLVRAFNSMSTTAVELAGEQAASRRNIADMFMNLGRRNQKMLNGLLRQINELERNEQDADQREAILEVDQTTTRMRRNADSLLVIAGASPSRRVKKPVPVEDVLRASLAAVVDASRVDISVKGSELMKGEFVSDVSHLVAELIENALTFSDPATRVTLTAHDTQRGYMIVVVDHGVGMSEERLGEANHTIISAVSRDDSPSKFIGHFVIGRLAARRGIAVTLLEGSVGGITARVLLPDDGLVRADATPAPAGHSGIVETQPLALSGPNAQPSLELSPVTSAISKNRTAITADVATAERSAISSPSDILPVDGVARKPGSIVAAAMDQTTRLRSIRQRLGTSTRNDTTDIEGGAVVGKGLDAGSHETPLSARPESHNGDHSGANS